MKYIIRSTDDKLERFELIDWKDNDRVAYHGPWPWVCAYSQLLNYEDMRVRGEIGGSVPHVWKLWPRDWRFPDRPMPREH